MKKTEDIEKTTGCPISWKSQDVNPRISKVKKSVKATKGKKKGGDVTVEKIVPSFFDLFADQSKEEFSASEEANFFKDDLFPNSLEYYLDIMTFDFQDDEDDEDDDEDDDEGSDDEPEQKPKAKKTPAAKAKGPETQEGKEKCKNQ